MDLLSSRRREFRFHSLLPSAEHPADLIELFGESRIFLRIDQLIFPSDLEKEFQKVEFTASGDEVSEFLFRFHVLRPEKYFQYFEKESVDFSSERIPMKFRNMRDRILPQSVDGLEPLQQGKNGGGVFVEDIARAC